MSSKPPRSVSQPLRLVALLPPSPNTSLSHFKPVVLAQEEARFYREASRAGGGGGGGGPVGGGAGALLSECAVVADEELRADTVELSGPKVRLELPCRVRVPGLVLQLRDSGAFCAVEVLVQDADGAALSLLASNRVSAIRVQGAQCAMPLELVPGWNILRLNLDRLVKAAFGKEFAVCTCVVIHAATRVARIYFQSEPLEDAELPDFLRTSRG